MRLSDELKDMNACPNAVEWVGKMRFATAWKKCIRPDWMLWYLGQKVGNPGWPTKQDIVLLACDFAESVLYLVPKSEKRPAKAIKAARKWAKNPTEKNRIAARYAADVAAYATYITTHAAHAADAATYSARAATYVTYSAAGAVCAAGAATDAVATHTADTNRKKQNKKMCDMIRKIYPKRRAKSKSKNRGRKRKK